MNIDTFPPQSSVTSRPLIRLVVPELDVYGLPPKYQSYYLPDAYFPVPRSPSPTTPGRHSSSFQGLPDLNSTPYALENSGTYRAGEIAQLQPTSVAMSNPGAAPFLFQTPSDPPTRPTIYARMATPATQQRTKQACDSCRERKTKCSGKRPVCQRCSTRGLICHYATARDRDSKLRNISRVRHHSSHSLAKCSSEVDDPIDKKVFPVPVAHAILAPRPIRPPIATPGLSTLPQAAICERWTPSKHPIPHHAPHREHPNETSAPGLIGVFTQTPSTIIPSFSARDLTPRASKDATPMMMSMFNQPIVTSPTSFGARQRVSWDYQSHQTNDYHYHPMSATESRHPSVLYGVNSSPPRLSIPLDQYAVPLVEQTSSPMATDSSGSSPTSSYYSYSPSSVNSTAPSSVTSSTTSDLPTIKTRSSVANVEQLQYPPDEDFSFMTDPAYYAYLVESTTAGGSFGKEGHQAAQSMDSQYQMGL